MSVSKSTTNKEGYAKYGGNRHHENNKVVIIESDMEKNFPRTYENLLVYTKGQNCSPTYEE